MEMRKVLRKATAIAASASFIGATMLGAVAQDLSKYPAPFVNNGVFDAFIVVGANAQPADVIGSVDIGASLQFSLKKATTVSAGAAAATIDQGIKIEKSGNKFNYGDNVNSVLDGTQLSAADLPTILADGKYVDTEGANKNTVTYTQDLLFVPQGEQANLTFTQDTDQAPTAGDYLRVKKNKQLYNYTLAFDTSINYDNTDDTTANDDWKTSTLSIEGKTYTVTNVALTAAAGKVDKLTLLSGEAVLWLTQNQPITKTVSGVEHTIEVVDVTDGADACQVKVDDSTVIIDKDATEVVNGLEIGITDVRAIHAQLQDTDVCQVSIGASELVLQNGENVKVDDVELEGSNVIFSESAAGNFDGMVVQLTPRELDNSNLYLSSANTATNPSAFTDPIFNSWKLVYGGLTAVYDDLSIKANGDTEGDFVFNNNAGKEIDIPLFRNSTLNIILGSGNGIDERLYAAGAGTHILQKACQATDSVEDCEGMQILASTTGGEAHIFELDNFDTAKNTTDVRDVTYGRTFEKVKYTDADSVDLNLGSFGTIKVNIDETNKNVTVIDSVKSRIETENLGSIDINDINSTTVPSSLNISIDERDRNGNNKIADASDGGAGGLIVSTVSLDSDSDLRVVPADWSNQIADVQTAEDSDFSVKASRVGSQATYDTKDDRSVVVKMPASFAYGNVFVAPIVAQLTTAAGGVPTYTLSKLNVGAAKLDSEIADVGANNLITVGGPCANKVTAQVLGLQYPACGAASGIAANTGIIKEAVQSSGKVALVVAGWEADDTRRASRVLSNFDQYALSGSSVTVTGTSMTDIQVQKSA